METCLINFNKILNINNMEQDHQELQEMGIAHQ
jgi:hypothetical protein